MFIPPTYKASDIFDEKMLEIEQDCLCNKKVKLRNAIVCFTHTQGKDNWGWFAACQGNCLVRHIAEGNC